MGRECHDRARTGRPPLEPTRRDSIFKAVALAVSRLLNNTPGVARKDYIDPRILNPEAFISLWKLCETEFPQLLQAKDISNSSEFSLDYDVRFEDLAVRFFEKLGSK